jgi:phospholipase/carboxylesterase
MPLTDLAWRTRRPAEGYYLSEVDSPDNLPVRTFLPIGYEPNYPYPLLVFLHGHGGNEERVLKLAPRMSRRNYVAISLRGPHLVQRPNRDRPGFGWAADGDADGMIEDYVINAIEQTRRDYHVHSERIYLAGVCEGASIAYRLGLTFPEKLAGVIALNGNMPMPGQNRPLFRLPELRQLRVMIAHGSANSKVPVGLARRDYQALYAAGLDVRMKTYPTTHRLHPDMLRDVNRWVMRQVAGEVDY